MEVKRHIFFINDCNMNTRHVLYNLDVSFSYRWLFITKIFNRYTKNMFFVSQISTQHFSKFCLTLEDSLFSHVTLTFKFLLQYSFRAITDLSFRESVKPCVTYFFINTKVQRWSPTHTSRPTNHTKHNLYVKFFLTSSLCFLDLNPIMNIK
jgi:hypothetical protein